jgi:hypothetical protein
MNALPDDSVQRLHDMVCRWSIKRLDHLRHGDEDAARMVGNWLFGVERAAEALGLIDLASKAQEAQFSDLGAHTAQAQS